MALIIRELVIRATVEQGQQQQTATPAPAAGGGGAQETVSEAVEQVLAILRTREER